MKNLFRLLLVIVARGLSRAGLIDKQRAKRTTELAWPRILTGFARQSQQIADVAMIGIVIGPIGIAGLGFAFPYWAVGNRIFLGLTGGTISQVSQRFGAGAIAELDLAVKQSVLATALLSLPIALLYLVMPTDLIGLLTNDPETIRYGATYLQVLAPAVVLEALNKVGSRVLVGADDSWTPMGIRAGGAIANIVLNIVFIFGLGMGVTGAALGTLAATLLVTLWFAVGFLAGAAPLVGTFPVTVTLTGPYLDWPLQRQLFDIAWPLIFRRLAETAAVFPLMAIVAFFGPVVVAAYVVGRRMTTLLNAPTWGFGLASSSLVGQELGRGNEAEAERYSKDTLRFALVIFLIFSIIVLVFARPIADVFADEPQAIDLTTTFVRISAISAIGRGIDGVSTGSLRASGDTRWPLYGKLVGLYLFAIPITYAATMFPLGLPILYVSLLSESWVPAAVSFYRLRTGKWKAISRGYRPDAT